LDNLWLILFVVSLVLLMIIAFRTKLNLRYFGFALLHLVVAAIALFFINGTGWFGEFYIPINGLTVFVVGILGVPGLALLVGIKLIYI
jgi:inhibitor of the pro-sigma K processing machinery